ncbi:MAG: hypothetical protein AVDCRST_MAG76-1710, partial [uncultured Acidimicrobiales bacterium]
VPRGTDRIPPPRAMADLIPPHLRPLASDRRRRSPPALRLHL